MMQELTTDDASLTSDTAQMEREIAEGTAIRTGNQILPRPKSLPMDVKRRIMDSLRSSFLEQGRLT